MIVITANDRIVSKYRNLLLSEWKRDFAEKVLALLWEAVSSSSSAPVEETSPLIKLLNPGLETDFPVDFFRSFAQQVSCATRFIRLANMPAHPPGDPLSRRMTKTVWAADRLAIYLTLPAQSPMEGDMHFFADLQALAFQAALHSVLPEIRKNHPAEHAILLQSALLYCLGYAAYDPAHLSYMMSMIHNYLGDEDQRLESLYASFRFTRRDDHSFLTKAQEYWTELLDRRRFDDAERFLFDLHWWSTPEQKDEVREMFIAALRFISTQGKQQASA
jgi:hypothetical protein